MPSLPNPTTHKGWPHHRGLRPLLFSNSSVGSFTSHKNRSVKALWDRTYGFSFLSDKTRKSNHLQITLQRQHFLLKKDPKCWSGRGLNPRPPTQQSGALPTDLTRQRLKIMDDQWDTVEPRLMATSLLWPFFWLPSKNHHTFSCKKALIKMATMLIRPIFFGPMVAVLTGFHCYLLGWH